MTDWYAPNQQAVRADGSGPAEEGTGGSTPSETPEPAPEATQQQQQEPAQQPEKSQKSGRRKSSSSDVDPAKG
jgi:hypothetical protein